MIYDTTDVKFLLLRSCRWLGTIVINQSVRAVCQIYIR